MNGFSNFLYTVAATPLESTINAGQLLCRSDVAHPYRNDRAKIGLFDQ